MSLVVQFELCFETVPRGEGEDFVWFAYRGRLELVQCFFLSYLKKHIL